MINDYEHVVREMKAAGVPTYTDEEGEHVDYPAWAKQLGMTIPALRIRLRRGMVSRKAWTKKEFEKAFRELKVLVK